MNSLEEYIKIQRQKLNENVFSPSFIRLANLYFINEEYDDCINICTIGLKIFPEYLTANILLLKALIKLEYISEAEKVFTEIKHRIPNKEIKDYLEKNITELKNKPKQERIFYPHNICSVIEFEEYKKNISEINDVKIQTNNIDDINNSEFIKNITSTEDFKNFSELFELFEFDNEVNQTQNGSKKEEKEFKHTTNPDSFLHKIQIVTETIADIYSTQGYLIEAFDVYNILILNNHPNKKRIQEKLYELERNLFSS